MAKLISVLFLMVAATGYAGRFCGHVGIRPNADGNYSLRIPNGPTGVLIPLNAAVDLKILKHRSVGVCVHGSRLTTSVDDKPVVHFHIYDLARTLMLLTPK